MIVQPLMGSYSNPLRVVDAADFDGTDYMTQASLQPIADGNAGLLSFWVRLDGATAGGTHIPICAWIGAGDLVFICGLTGNDVYVVARDSGLTTLLSMDSRGNRIPEDGTWHHVLMSWQLGTPNARHIYVDDIADTNVATFNSGNIAYNTSVAGWAVGGGYTGASFNGAIAELYFSYAHYMDLSIVSNRRKFISAGGKPVHLGTSGLLPTGEASNTPCVYLHLDDGEAVANFATNRGTGGNFTITGTLATASSSPSD